MFTSWKKVKRSGHYKRKIRKDCEAMLQRAYRFDAERMLKTSEARQTAAPPISVMPSYVNNQQHVWNDQTSSRESAPSRISSTLCPDLMDIGDNVKNQINSCVNSSTDVPITHNKEDGNEVPVVIDENSEEEDYIDKNRKLRSDLRQWAIQYNITHSALNDLIRIFNCHLGEKILPEDSRTLLLTPRSVNIVALANGDGEYWHHGFKTCLSKIFSHLHESITISVNINLDGLPVYKGSKVELWPILFNITDMPQMRPMVIGIFCGEKKCSDLDAFLTPFVDEMNEVLANGMIVNSHKITVLLRCFICDSPARAFVKGVAGFNGQHGCQRCTTIGEYSYVTNTNIFPRTECEKRTDESFRKKLYGDEHHKVDSPLLKLPIDMIDQFVVADSLHLLHLGVMKRLLYGWRDGSFRNSDTKWRAQTTTEVSEYLTKCKMPAEFHRVVRGLDCLSHWKGTEYRTFLHYVGIVALKDHLTSEAYEHFLLLFCVATICTSKQYFHMLHVARLMILQYIEIFGEIYGKQYITSNVHNLAHLLDDVEHFGVLDSFSAYPFENLLGQIKRLVRNGNRPLAQIAKRIIEDCRYEGSGTTSAGVQQNEKIVVSKRNDGNNVPESVKSIIKSVGTDAAFYSNAQLKTFRIGTDPANCWFLSNQNGIVRVINIIRGSENRIKLCCIESQEKCLFFKTPIESRHLNIYTTRRDVHSKETEAKAMDLGDIKCKLVRMDYHEMYVFIPLLHTNEVNGN